MVVTLQAKHTIAKTSSNLTFVHYYVLSQYFWFCKVPFFGGKVVLNCKRNYDLVHIYILFIFMSWLECFFHQNERIDYNVYGC
jgi:hypothetical protein